jgi:ABC-type sugar transport system substrate-binding protein
MMALMASPAAAQQKAGIALSMCDLDTARSVAIASDIMDGAEEAGYALEMRSAEHRLSAQISDIHQLTEAEPQYLVIVAVKAVGLGKAIRAAAEKGIKVILVDRLSTDARPEDILCAIGADCEWAGGECAKALAARFEGRRAKILEIQGEAGASTTNGFAKGFRDRLCDYENLEIAGVVPNAYSREAAQQGLLKFYERNGAGFDAVFGHGDEEGLGAVGALFSLEEAQGLPVIAIGGSDDAKRALAAERLAACVEVTPYFADAVLAAVRADAAGGPVESLRLVRGAVVTSPTPYERGY